MRSLTRRKALVLGAVSATTILSGAHRSVRATPADAAAEIAKFTGGKTAETGRITIELPEIAENGNAVPLSVVVDSPMTPDNYVSDILVVAEGNPWPGVATFKLTPMSGRAEAATRIRLAASQNLLVVAKTSNGGFLTAQRQVKVTIGGCGG
jgi:sulfur-oxidizing protein SoxY